MGHQAVWGVRKCLDSGEVEKGENSWVAAEDRVGRE